MMQGPKGKICGAGLDDPYTPPVPSCVAWHVRAENGTGSRLINLLPGGLSGERPGRVTELGKKLGKKRRELQPQL